MTRLQCKNCKAIIVEDIDKIDRTQKYIQCPICARQMINPFHET
jgi:ribosomal protein S27E